jgi:hypothetical protein
VGLQSGVSTRHAAHPPRHGTRFFARSLRGQPAPRVGPKAFDRAGRVLNGSRAENFPRISVPLTVPSEFDRPVFGLDSRDLEKTNRSFKPKVASSNLVGRIPRCSGRCRGGPVQSQVVGRGAEMRSGGFLSIPVRSGRSVSHPGHIGHSATGA